MLGISGLIVFAILGFILYRASDGAIRTVDCLKDQVEIMALGDFSNSVEEAAASAQEIESSSEELARIAENLIEHMNNFKI